MFYVTINSHDDREYEVYYNFIKQLNKCRIVDELDKKQILTPDSLNIKITELLRQIKQGYSQCVYSERTYIVRDRNTLHNLGINRRYMLDIMNTLRILKIMSG